MWIKKLFNKNTIGYLSLNYVNTFLNVLLNLILIKNLSAYNFGKVSIGKTIFQSFEFSHIGIRYGFDRFFPHQKNKNNLIEMFSVGILSTAIFSFAFVCFWFIYEDENRLFYLYFSVSGFLYSIIMLYRIYYRSQEEKKDFVNISIYSILLPTISQLIGFYFYNITGLVVSFFLSYILVILIIAKKYSIKIVWLPHKNIPIFKKLINKGILLFFTSLLAFFSSSGDRFFIAEYWGLEAVGIFSIVMFFFSIFSMFSVNYTEMIMNKIIVSRSLKFSAKHMAFLFCVISLLCFIAYLVIPFLVLYFIPLYTKQIPFINIILLAVVPFSVKSILNYYLMAIDKRTTIFLVELLITLLYFAGLIYSLKYTQSLLNIMYLKVCFYFSGTALTLFFAIIYSYRKNKFSTA